MRRTTSGLLVVGLVLTLLAVPVAALAQRAPSTSPFQDRRVTGTVPGGGTFQGTLDITSFAVQNDQLVAQGDLTGTLRNAVGTVIGTVSDVPVTLPVTARGTCRILHLELGPLDLDLLGLMVHLDKVVLDITAQQGPGNRWATCCVPSPGCSTRGVTSTPCPCF